MRDHWEGGCLCGAVRFRAAGDPRWIGWRHIYPEVRLRRRSLADPVEAA